MSAGVDPTRRVVGAIGLAVAVGIAYFLAARLSLALLTDGVAVFWPAAGVSAGVLIAFGGRARLPVAVGTMAATIVANLMGDRNFASTVVFALSNAGEAMLTAWLIEHRFGRSFNLGRLRDVLGLVAAAIIGTAASGVGGIVGFKVFQGSTVPIWTTLRHWIASDGIGIIIVAPLVIGLVSAARDRPSRKELTEGVAALVLLIAIGGLVLSLPAELLATVVPVALLFPPLLWLAARCRPVFVAAAVFIASLTIVFGTTFGIGQLGNQESPIAERALPAQASILLMALGALVLVALFTEIRDQSRRLAEASKHKSQFLANMSHELRTPLNAILGYTELILDNLYGDTPDKMRKVLDRVQQNGKHLLGLINDVLDLSKIEAGQLTLSLNDYSLDDVVRNVFTAVEALASEKKLALEVEVQPDLPHGHADERRVTQVLLNLVGNAIKFTDAGGVAVRATASGNSFTIAVRDTGPGIAESDQARIFEEFQQVEFIGDEEEGRHRARLVDCPEDRRDAGRQALGRVQAWGGLDVLLHPSDPCQNAGGAE